MTIYSRIFAKNLKAARRAMRLTQHELAEALNYSEKAVSKWEAGGAIPPVDVIIQLSALLHISFDELFDQEVTPSYLLGVDSGRINTEFLLTDLSENPIKSLSLGPSYITAKSLSGALAVIDEGIKEITDGIAFKRICACLSCARDHSVDTSVINDYMAKYHFASSVLSSDIDAALIAALGEEDGILVTVGGGSAVFSRRGTNIHITGGYGDLFGDSGSAYNIGLLMLHALLKEKDRRILHTNLTELFEQILGHPITRKSEISDYSMLGKETVASLAPSVFDAYLMGDDAAIRIIEDEYLALGSLLPVARIKSGFNERTKTVLIGGLSRYGDIIIPLLYRAIRESGDDEALYDITAADTSTVAGSIKLAKKEVEASLSENR